MRRHRLLLTLATAMLVFACAQPAPQNKQQDRAAAEPAPAPAEAEARALADAVVVHRRAALAAQAEVAQGAAGAIAPAPAASPDPLGGARYAPMIQDAEKYQHLEDGSVLRVAEHPVSTFSIDVDTGSYSNVRRFLRDGALPRQDAVRVEEMINYFDYAYAPPKDRSRPFSVHTELAPTPWNEKTHLLRVGLQGWKPPAGAALPPSNLVFLVDVSGSMESADKLGLVKSSLQLLTQELGARDRISLVVYAGASGVVLEPTPGDQKDRI